MVRHGQQLIHGVGNPSSVASKPMLQLGERPIYVSVKLICLCLPENIRICLSGRSKCAVADLLKNPVISKIWFDKLCINVQP